MKTLLALLFGLLPLAGQAQQSPSARQLATHADSVATLRQVFRFNRRFSRLGALTAAPVLGFGVDELAIATSTPRQILSSAVIGIYTAYLVKGVVNWRRYSKRREAEAVQRFEQHQLQPPYLQKRLLTAFNH